MKIKHILTLDEPDNDGEQSMQEQQQVNLYREVVFKIEDGKVCGFEEQVAE